jgi:hypothetical protein
LVLKGDNFELLRKSLAKHGSDDGKTSKEIVKLNN